MELQNFFILEGIDGSGKTTTIEILKKMIKRLHLTDCFVFLFEPTNLTYGRIIRQYLKEHKQLSLEEWLKLFDADRKENLKENLIPNQNKIIVMDRYYFSTAAYQGRSIEDVKRIFDYFYNHFPPPKTVFYLDISLEEALRRISKRKEDMGKVKEVFETNEELKRVLNHYKYLQELSHNFHIQWENINALENPYKNAKMILRNIFSKVQDIKKGEI